MSCRSHSAANRSLRGLLTMLEWPSMQQNIELLQRGHAANSPSARA